MLWNESYIVGNDMVDNDHKEIFGMVDRLLEDDFAGRSEKIKTVVKFLVDYVAGHFAREEKLMRECGYPDYEAHAKMHRDFVGVAKGLEKKLSGDLENIDLSTEVNEVLVDWLAEHVLARDKVMISHYRKWAAGGK